jgi:hypothetical protein
MTCVINGKAVIPDKQNWPRLLVAIAERFISEKNPNLAKLNRIPIYRSKVFFMHGKSDFGNCSLLSNGKWIYTNYDSQTIITIIGNLCRHCGAALDNVVITYSLKDRDILRNEKNFSSFSKAKTIVNDETMAIIVAILEEHFSNGIRPISVIDINKLKNRYLEITGEKIILLDIDISTLLNTIGIQCGEKVFLISSSVKKSLALLLERLIIEDNRLFYYEEFYDTHADYLQAMNIFSAELLKAALPEAMPSLCYLKKYFVTNRSVSIESEILRCYETAVCLSYEQLKSKLPYAPFNKIKQILAQNSGYIRVNTSTYTHVNKVEIDEKEQVIAKYKVNDEIAEHGYVSLALLDVSASLELNHGISEPAVKNSLFQIFLSDRYEKRGNIISEKGAVLNSSLVFENYCLSHDRLTLDELLKFEKEINGSVHSQSLFVAYDTMVRADKDTFVSDSEINFDIEAADNALALFVCKDVIALRAVTSFTSFPYIDGYLWNLFLLESYCKRFSKRFKFQCLSVSSQNVGAIFRKSAGFDDYVAVLAAAVANSSVVLDAKEVGNFLFDSGYVAARTANTISKVTMEARVLRERRV